MAGTPDQYRVLVGINYPPGDKRAEPGDIVNDLPDYAIKGLLEQGVIERPDAAPAPAVEPEPAPVEAPAPAETDAPPVVPAPATEEASK